MSGDLAGDRAAVGRLLDGFRLPVLWPNSTAGRPAPTTSGEPSGFVSVSIEYPQRPEPIDFEGGTSRAGVAVLSAWIESRAGDEALAELVDELLALVPDSDDAAGLLFWPPAGPVGAPTTLDGFYGRRVEVPFLAV